MDRDSASSQEGKKSGQLTGGWVSLWRKSLDNGLYPTNRNVKREPFTHWEAWMDILLNVAHEDHSFVFEGKQVLEKRGEWRVSIRYLAERWGWGHNKIMRFLNDLRKENAIMFIAERSGERLTRHTPGGIFLMNFDSYQNNNSHRGTLNGTLKGTLNSQEVPADPHQKPAERSRNACDVELKPKSEKLSTKNGTKHNNTINTTNVVEPSAPKSSSKRKKQKRSISTKEEEKGPAYTILLEDHFLTVYRETFKKPYTLKHEKDRSLLKNLLGKKHSLTDLKLAIELFMEDNDPFLKKTGHTIGMFYKKVNSLMERISDMEKSQAKEV